MRKIFPFIPFPGIKPLTSGVWGPGPAMLIIFALCFFTLFCQAQNTPTQLLITGKVVDSLGTPVEGASIMIKGTSKGVLSDRNGSFSIASGTPVNTIVVTAVGYFRLESSVSAGKNATLVLNQLVSSLDDVVVIGYGTQRKSNLTGAVSTVDKAMLDNRPVTNAVGALQGTAPGLVITRLNGQPGQEGYDINIRGFASLNGTNNPLVIIDGVEGDLSLLNPNDIQDISVLKDAAAASIYGAKAAGGVLLVTTKKGAASNKVTVALTSLNSILKRYAVPEVLHSWEQAEMTNAAQTNAGVNKLWSDQQIRWMKDADTNVVAGQPYYDINVGDYVLRNTSQSYNQNLTISGGSDKAVYLIGLGYYKQNGVFDLGPDGTKRYNARFNTTIKLNPRFSFDSRIAYTYSGTQSPSASVNGDNGLLYNIYSLRTIYPIFADSSNNTKYSSLFAQNDYAILNDGGYNNTDQHNITGVFSLTASLAKKISLRLVYSPGFLQNANNIFVRSIPTYQKASTSSPTSYINPTNSIAKSRTTQYTHNVQALLDYDFSIKKDHRFHVLGGFEYKYYNYNYNYVKVAGLISNDIPAVNLFSPSSVYTVSDNIQTNTWYSGFSRLNYNYKGIYIFEVNLRYDASSRLAPGHRGQAFPSFSAGYNMAREEWFSKALPFFSDFKIRGSWGKLGNAQLGALNTNNYNYIAQLVSGGQYPFNNQINPSYYQANLPSEALGWETVQTTNIGLDIGVLKQRLKGSFEYFVRSNNNMLITVNWPAVLGVTPPTTNGASMRTKGWEASLNWNDRIGKDFTYRIGVGIADNTNKVTRYAGQNTVLEGRNAAILGYPINSIFGFIDDGYFKDAADVAAGPFLDARNGPGDIKYRDMNHDNTITVGSNTIEDHGDLVYLGNTTPRYQYTINLGFQWKGFDLSAFFQGIGKRNLLLNPNTIVPFVQTWRQPWAVHTDYWTPENTDARFPRLFWYNASSVSQAFNARTSTHWVQNGAYLRLKNLQIGYSLPQNLLRRMKLQKVRIFVSGEDLWESVKMWFPYTNPESTQATAGWNYPFFRTYSAGLNVTF